MRTSFILHFDMMPTVDLLSNAELVKVIKAVYHYNVNGELPEKLSTSSSILFQQIKAQHDRDRQHYEEVSQKRAQAAQAKKEKAAQDEELLALRDRLRSENQQL